MLRPDAALAWAPIVYQRGPGPLLVLRAARPGRCWGRAGRRTFSDLERGGEDEEHLNLHSCSRSRWVTGAGPAWSSARGRGRRVPTPCATLAARPPANATRAPQQHRFKTARLTLTLNSEVPQLKYKARNVTAERFLPRQRLLLAAPTETRPADAVARRVLSYTRCPCECVSRPPPPAVGFFMQKEL